MALTLREAAYLMGIPVQEAIEMAQKGSLLILKFAERGAITENTMVAGSEMTRFEHPWRQIFRLEERINAQQNLVETLKKNINGDELRSVKDDTFENKVSIEQLEESVSQNKILLMEINNHMPDILETVEAIKGMLRNQELPPHPAARKNRSKKNGAGRFVPKQRKGEYAK